MKNFVIGLVTLLFKISFWFRYRVTYKGLENLDPKILNKPGGTLFLPNHPAVFVDPVMVTMGIWRKYPVRPMIIEYFYYQPFVHAFVKKMNALPVPNFDVGSNSLKRKRNEEMIQTVIDDVKKGDSFLIYPSGRTKQTGYEAIGGASAVHRIIQEAPETNIILVRTKGLWGSSFSRAFTGAAPSLFGTLFTGIKHVLKNFIFFTPRREVIIEYHKVPADFPYKSTKMEFNQWLERWYNTPDGLTVQEGDYPGDSLCLVPYSIWNKKIPELHHGEDQFDEQISTKNINPEIHKKVLKEISTIASIPVEEVKPWMRLDRHLGMDSLDISDLSSYIQDNFDVKQISVPEMTTVAKVLAIADKKVRCETGKGEALAIDFEKWRQLPECRVVTMPAGDTIPEVFLNNCKRMGNAVACGDERTGILTYKELKMRVILLADYIQKLPGEYIGILLPSSVAAYAVILACQLAGKTPLLINWATGARHIKAVKTLSKVEVVLTSWAFIDRLENVDLNGIEDDLLMLEDVRREFTVKDKLRALYRSKLSTYSILKAFNTHKTSKNDKAVLLFTSGTESQPKGVPLSHDNVLSNQRQAVSTIDFYSNDVMLGILPPFHAFGFNLSGLMALMLGIRVVYFPDPTDGHKLAAIIRDWKVSLTCGAPTFLKGIFKSGTPETFKTLRLCVTGAEKAPPELFARAKDLGLSDVIIEGYGVTECSPVLTANRPGKGHCGVGEPVNGVEIRIVHPDTHQPLEHMQRGLVIAKGPNVFSGYINPDLTSPFINIEGENWYNTGDLGYLDDQNRLIISGRQKRFIKIGGEMISLAAIEDALLQAAPTKGWEVNPDGPTLAVCAKEVTGEKAKIFLFTAFETTVDDVNQVLREAGFSNLVKVASVVVLPEIPIMGTGKVFYRELENTYLA